MVKVRKENTAMEKILSENGNKSKRWVLKLADSTFTCATKITALIKQKGKNITANTQKIAK